MPSNGLPGKDTKLPNHGTVYDFYYPTKGSNGEVNSSILDRLKRSSETLDVLSDPTEIEKYRKRKFYELGLNKSFDSNSNPYRFETNYPGSYTRSANTKRKSLNEGRTKRNKFDIVTSLRLKKKSNSLCLTSANYSSSNGITNDMYGDDLDLIPPPPPPPLTINHDPSYLNENYDRYMSFNRKHMYQPFDHRRKSIDDQLITDFELNDLKQTEFCLNEPVQATSFLTENSNSIHGPSLANNNHYHHFLPPYTTDRQTPTQFRSTASNDCEFHHHHPMKPIYGRSIPSDGCCPNAVNHPENLVESNNPLFFYHLMPHDHLPTYDHAMCCKKEPIEIPERNNLGNRHPIKYNTIGSIGYRRKTKEALMATKTRHHSSFCNLTDGRYSLEKQLSNVGSGVYDNKLNNCIYAKSLSNFNLHNHTSHPPMTQLPYKNKSFLPYGSIGINGDFDDNNSIVLRSSSCTPSGCSGSLTNPQKMGSGVAIWSHRQCHGHGFFKGWNLFRHWLAITSIIIIAGAAGVAVPLALRVAAGAPFEERLEAATQLLNSVPLIDGHNDLPWNIRKFLHNQINDFKFDEDLRNVMPWAKSQWSHTDLKRLKMGRVSAQFWAAYVPCQAQYRDAVQLTLEQIDVIRRLTDKYSPQIRLCASAADIREAHKNHQLCSLTGVEGGHSLGNSLGVLRTFYSLGVRYMTLTSTCHTPWADSSNADSPKYTGHQKGLTSFGKTIIREMNRIGMIVDLSHVSVATMRDALSVSEAPLIFSHSSAYDLCKSNRNVQNDVLKMLAKNNGIIMVNFYSMFLSCSENATVHDAVAHINHIRRIAGVDHVGLGAGFDGINYTPNGLEDVSSYPRLFAELLGDGWTVEELAKLAGENFLRVLEEVEKLRDAKKAAGVRPYEDISNHRTEDLYNCTTN